MNKKNFILQIILILILILALGSLTGCSILDGLTGNSGDNNTGDSGENIEQENHVHEWSEWEAEALPTISDNGTLKRRCACGEVETISIPQIDNKHYNLRIIDSTCSEEGKKIYTLNKDYYDYRYIDFSFEEVIEKKPHKYVYHGDSTGHWQVCEVCGNKTDVEPHDKTNSNGCIKCGLDVDTSYFDVVLNSNGVGFLKRNKGKTLPKNVVIPSEIDGHHIYGFYDFNGVFANTDIESVYIQDGIENIDSNTFSNCKKLKNIYIPGSVKYIGSSSFANCTALEKIELHEGTTTIYPRAFWGSNLKEISIPSTVTSIQEGAFAGTTKLRKFNLSNENKYYKIVNGCLIGTRAGINLGTLYAVSGGAALPTDAYITRIGEYALYGYGLYGGEIRIPSTVKSIGKNAFYMSQTGKIILPDSVETIEEYAFKSCYHLTYILIPHKVTQLNDFIFENCDELRTISIYGKITSVGQYTCSGCNKEAVIQMHNVSTQPAEWNDRWNYVGNVNGVDYNLQVNWATNN